MTRSRNEPVHSIQRLVLLAILWVAFAARCVGLDHQELRGDEAFGYFFSLPPLEEIVQRTLDLGEPHPVASYWLQHGWLMVAGHSEFALRFLGVWWSVLAVALMVPLAIQLRLSISAATVAAALLAFSPYTIWHSQDARMYSMSLALTLASTLLAVRWWRSRSRARSSWIALAYVLITWLALHTHYFSLYIIMAQNIGITLWAVAERSWRKLLLWVGCGVAVLLLWMPWLWAARAILLGYHGNGDSPGLFEAIVRAHSAFVGGESVAAELRILVALLALVAMTVGVIAMWRQVPKARAGLVLLITYWFVPFAATWLSAQSRPIFNERYLVAAVPPVYMLMAAAVGSWQEKRVEKRVEERVVKPLWRTAGTLVIVMLLGVMLVSTVRQSSDPSFSKSRGWRELAQRLEQLTAGGAPQAVRLAQNYPDPTLWYYFQGDAPHLVLPPAAHDRARAGEEVERMVGEGVGQVVLVEQPAASWDDEALGRDALAAAYEMAGSLTVAQWPLSIWLRPGGEFVPLDVAYEGGLQLIGDQITPQTTQPGGMVAVHLQWQIVAGSVSDQESVSVQMLNAAGELVAQSDRRLPPGEGNGGATLATYAILLPVEMSVGDYHVEVVVYDPSREGSPRRLTMQGADAVRLGQVSVVGSEEWLR